jgi:hypothetical protein
MKTHSENVARFGTPEFRVAQCKQMDGAVRPDGRPTCSYCGSLTVADAIKAFQTPGVRWSGCDWKYSWPHKFYIEIPCEPYRKCTSKGPGEHDLGYSECRYDFHKFYAEHLVDATPEQLEQWNRIVEPITGIGYELDGDWLKYSARCLGWQGSGVIS